MRHDNVILDLDGPRGVPLHIGSTIFFLAVLLLPLIRQNVGLVDAMLFLMLIFASVTFGGLAKAWAAHVQAIPVQRVLIYGAGSYCEHEPVPAEAEEFIVMMGPLSYLSLWAAGTILAPILAPFALDHAVAMAAEVNLFLLLISLMPVRPLEGGYLYELLLNRVTDRDSAQRIAGGFGVAMALLWVPMMLFLFSQTGFALLVMPPLHEHLMMARGEAPRRPYRRV